MHKARQRELHAPRSAHELAALAVVRQLQRLAGAGGHRNRPVVFARRARAIGKVDHLILDKFQPHHGLGLVVLGRVEREVQRRHIAHIAQVTRGLQIGGQALACAGELNLPPIGAKGDHRHAGLGAGDDAGISRAALAQAGHAHPDRHRGLRIGVAFESEACVLEHQIRGRIRRNPELGRQLGNHRQAIGQRQREGPGILVADPEGHVGLDAAAADQDAQAHRVEAGGVPAQAAVAALWVKVVAQGGRLALKLEAVDFGLVACCTGDAQQVALAADRHCQGEAVVLFLGFELDQRALAQGGDRALIEALDQFAQLGCDVRVCLSQRDVCAALARQVLVFDHIDQIFITQPRQRDHITGLVDTSDHQRANLLCRAAGLAQQRRR